MLDRMHTGANVGDIKEEIEEVRADNTHNAARLEQLYLQNRDLEEQIQRVETQVQNVRNNRCWALSTSRFQYAVTVGRVAFDCKKPEETKEAAIICFSLF